MNRKLAIGLAAIGGALLLTTRRRKPRSIAVYGDSHSQGVAPALRALAPSGTTFIAVSRVGFTAERLATDAGLQAAFAGKPEIALLVAGTNDAAINPARTADGAERLVKTARAASPRTKLIWIGPPHETGALAAKVDQVAAALRTRLAQLNVPFIDIRDWTAQTEQYGADGIHLKPIAYAALAQRIAARAWA